MKKIYFSTLIVLFGMFTQNVNAQNVVLRAGGNPTTPSDWGLAPNGTTGTLANFGGNRTYSFTSLNSAVTLAASWSITAGSSIVVGDGATPFMLTISSGGTITSQPRITITNLATLTLNNADNFNFSAARTIFNTGSTVIYGAGSAGIKAYANPYYNLVINTSSSLGGGSYSVSNDLTVNSPLDLVFNDLSVGGNIALNANIQFSGGVLTVGGSISGSGLFLGDIINSTASLFLNGSGNVGTINFQAGSRLLSNLSVGGGGTVTLGSDLLIDGGALNLSTGSLDLNGHTLAIDNTSGMTTADFNGGTIIGSSASALAIEASAVNGPLTMDATANTLKSLYLRVAGQSLALANTLNITDSISAYEGDISTGGNLTIRATSSLKGRVGTMSAAGSISGPATVEIFSPGGLTSWSQLGIGGVQNQTIGNWETQFPMTCHSCIYDINSAGTGFYSIQGWDAAGINTFDGFDTTAVINVNTPLTPGRGFWVYLGTSAGTTGPITITNAGPLVQGGLTYNVSNAFQAEDMIANPYASPISWDKLFDLNGGLTNFQTSYVEIWDADAGTYVQINYGDGVSIAAGQGFYVSPFMDFPLAFNESIKTADNTSSTPLMKTAASTAAISGFTLTVKGSNGDFDKAEFRFNTNASTTFDRAYDSYKRFATPGYVGYPGPYSHYTTISSRIQNTDYYRNTLPVLTNTLSIPILVKVSATGVYTIAAANFKNFNSCTMLKDNLTGIYHNLASGDYVCTINDTTSAPRFELFLCEQNVPTALSELNNVSQNIGISQDQAGPFVTTHFTQNTKATISVYNIVGQQLIKDLEVEGTDTTTRLNLDAHNQVLLIRVSTDKETITKKIIAH